MSGAHTPASPMPGAPPATEADSVAAAVLSCPGVVALGQGTLATYLAGRRVDGVRIGDDGIEVAVVTEHGVPVPQVAAEIRAVVSRLAGGRRVDVHVTDLRLPDEPAAEVRELPPAPPTDRPRADADRLGG